MRRASISQIKMNLSKFINFVRKGEEVIILDRDRPIAKMAPFSEEERTTVLTTPKSDNKALMTLLKAQTYHDESDILEILSAEREDRF